MRHLLPSCACAILLCVFPASPHAAEVWLKNGDRITGTIVKMQNHKLEIEPSYSSIVTIDWKDVLSIENDYPMSVFLYGNVPVPESLSVGSGGAIIRHRLEPDGPIRLEDVRAISLSSNYRGYVSIGGNQSSGNSEAASLHTSGSMTYQMNNHRVIVDARHNRGAVGTRQTANNASADLAYNYLFARRAYAGFLDLIEYDQFQNLTVRNSAGGLLGYDILDMRDHTLTFAGGPAVAYQDFTSTPATVIPSTAWMIRYEFRFRGDDVILFHRQIGFKDLGHGYAVRVNADQGIRVKLYKDINLNVQYDIRYNSEPSLGRKTLDTNIIFGLSYELKP